MRMKLFLLLIAVTLLLGCGGGDGGPRKADLRVSFEPNPVVRAADGRWHFRVVLEEKNGTGVVINGFTVDMYAPNGEFLHEDFYTPSTFAEWFDDCGGVDNYVAGDQTRCANIVAWSTSGYRDWTFSGKDDLGNDVSVTGRVTLQ